MSYEIHTTPALILGSIAVADADRYFYLLTRDFGYIGALAKGVRLQKSKLRYALQEGNQVIVSVVRGKQIWRITNASEPLTFASEKKDRHLAFLRVAQLIRRLLHTDETQKNIFEIVENFHRSLTEQKYTKETLLAHELLVTGALLQELGYWDSDAKLPPIADANESTLTSIYQNRELFVTTVKKSIEASQL